MDGQEHWIQTVFRWLQTDGGNSTEETTVRDSVASQEFSELESLLSVLTSNPEALERSLGKTRLLFQLLAGRVISEVQKQEGTPGLEADNLRVAYEILSGVDQPASAHVLQMLTAQADEDSLHTAAELLIESPPEDWQNVGLGLSPLWHAPGDVVGNFLEQIADALLHPSTMAVLLDLANYSVRENKLKEHPWSERAEQLASLLKELVNQLQQMEEDPSQFGNSVEAVQQRLSESLALTISLCDSLGLIGDQESKTSLNLALSLSHRRIQTEAAGALAVLGDDQGKTHLLQLAEDRAARLRAVTYADELGFGEEIPAELRAPQALAESELASWLAAPEQFGMAPNSMELVETRSQYWPSYEEPRDCFLFRYNYMFPQGSVSNIGIAGPLTHSFAADLGNLPVDDIFAAFAGWQAEHEEIFEVPATALNPAQRREADNLNEIFVAQELEVTKTIALTFFFGEIALLAEVTKDGKQLCALTDGQETLCHPINDSPASLTPDIVLCIYRGRKLLRTFNP